MRSRGFDNPHRPPGFTLLELVLALSISTIVLLGVASMIGLATKVAPGREGVQDASRAAGDLFAQLRADLLLAQKVVAADPASITLSVPSRTGAALSDTVVYEWGGSPGDPVTLRINGGAQHTLVPHADSFALSASRGPVTAYTPRTEPAASSGTLQSGPLLLPYALNLAAGVAVAQYVSPTLPSDAVAWRISEISLSLSESSNDDDGVFLVEVRDVASGRPGSKLYYETSVIEKDLSAALSDYSLKPVPFWIPPTEAVCIIIRHESGYYACRVGAGLTSLGYSGGNLYTTSDGGASWTLQSGYTAGHSVSGEVLRSSGGASTRTALETLELDLVIGPWRYQAGVTPINPSEAP